MHRFTLERQPVVRLRPVAVLITAGLYCALQELAYRGDRLVGTLGNCERVAGEGPWLLPLALIIHIGCAGYLACAEPRSWAATTAVNAALAVGLGAIAGGLYYALRMKYASCQEIMRYCGGWNCDDPSLLGEALVVPLVMVVGGFLALPVGYVARAALRPLRRQA